MNGGKFDGHSHDYDDDDDDDDQDVANCWSRVAQQIIQCLICSLLMTTLHCVDMNIDQLGGPVEWGTISMVMMMMMFKMLQTGGVELPNKSSNVSFVPCP